MYEIFEKLLNERNITAYRFCKDTGISTSTISAWKNRKSKISPDLAEIICEYFGVSIDYLLTGKTSQSQNNAISISTGAIIYSTFENLCHKHNVTAYRVCKETGLTTATISNWKAGRYTPKTDKLQKIADYFDIPLDNLLSTNIKDISNIEKTSESLDLFQKYKELKNLLRQGKTNPIYINGKEKNIDSESINLLIKHLDIFISLIQKLSN